MPVNGIELKEGQKWKTLYGRVATLQDNPRAKSYIFRAVYEDGGWNTVTEDGKLWTIDYDSFLIELIYDPEQVKEKLTMKFNPKSEPTKLFLPKPGDKIICNNGEEFICCTLEFLRETIYEGSKSDKPILGYRKFGYDEVWMDWDEDGYASFAPEDDYDIREVIPQSSEVTDDKNEEVKEEPRYKAATAEQPLYTVEEVLAALEIVSNFKFQPYDYENEVAEYLNKIKSPEYQEYLRLKAIYE